MGSVGTDSLWYQPQVAITLITENLNIVIVEILNRDYMQ